MAIETLTLLDGTKKYRGKIGRVIDGKRKVFNTPYVSSRAEAVRLEKLLGEQYKITPAGRVAGKDYTDASRGVIPDKEATKKYKNIIDDKFKSGYLTTKKWSEMSQAQRANIASAYRFQKNLDERVVKFKLGGKNVELPQGMRFSSLSRSVEPVKEGVKKLQKWNKNPTPSNWSKIFGTNNFARNLRSYITGRDSTAGIKISDEAKKIFDAVDIKQFVKSKDIDTIINLDQTLKPAGAQLGSVKARKILKGKMINELNFTNQDPVVKNFLRGDDFGKNKIRQVSTYLAKKLKVTPSIAARRIQEVAKGYLGNSDLVNFQSKDANLMKGVARINSIVENSPFNDLGSGFKRDLYETYISKSLNEKPSFMSRTRQDISKVMPKNIAIDEIRNVATGAKVKNPGYSIFVQGIDDDINLSTKRKVDSAVFNAEKKLQELSPFDPNYDEKRKIIKDKYNKIARKFAKEANAGYKGNLPVRAFELSFDEPSKSVSRYSELPKNVSSLLDANYKEFDYSFKVPKDVKTMYEVKEQLDTSPTSFLRKVFSIKGPRVFQIAAGAYLGSKLLGGEAEAAEPEIKYNPEIGAVVNTKTDDKVPQSTILEWASENPIPVAAVASTPLLSKTVRQGTGKLLKGLLSTLASPLAATGFAGATIKENLDEGKNIVDATVDPMVGVELLYPEAAKRVGAKGITGALGRALSLGRVGAMLTPAGLGITALGLGKMGYNALQAEKEKLAGMSDDEREAYLAQAEEQMMMAP